MRANGWAQIRVSVPPARSNGAIAEVVGDGRTRLHARLERAKPAAPIRGALSYPATWHAGRHSGEAIVSVIPQWSWGYELHLAVAAPDSLAGRISWPRRRLERLADGLATALKDAAERSARSEAHRPRIRRRVPSAGRWSFGSATSSSSR